MADPFIDLSGVRGGASRETPALPPRARSVLLELLRTPRASDQALARAVKLTASVVGATRRGLIAQGLLAPARYPSLHHLGATGFALLTAHAPLGASWEAGQLAQRAFVRDTPSVLLAALGARSSAYLVALRGHEEQGELRTRLVELSARWPGPPAQVTAAVVVPTRTSGFLGLPAFSTVVAQLQREEAVASSEPQSLSQPPAPGAASLPRRRTDILRALLQFPPRSDEKIARELGLSRQAVDKARAALAEEGWFSDLWLPALGLLGAELVAFLHLPSWLPKERGGVPPTIPAPLQPFTFLGFLGRSEGMLVGVWDRFETLEETVAGAASEGIAEWLDPRDPYAAVFPLAETALLLRTDFSDFLKLGKDAPNP